MTEPIEIIIGAPAPSNPTVISFIFERTDPTVIGGLYVIGANTLENTWTEYTNQIVEWDGTNLIYRSIEDQSTAVIDGTNYTYFASSGWSPIGTGSGVPHAPTSLATDTVTQESISLNGQELVVNLVSSSSDGVMSSEDKSKLDGIQAGANDYVHPNHTGDVSSLGDGATLINNGAVTEVKIDDGAVTSNKINDNAVIESKLASNSITESKINNDVVTNAKLANMPSTSVKVRVSNSAGNPTDLSLTSGTALANLNGTIVAATIDQLAMAFATVESGTAFPAQPTYGNFRNFYRTDLFETFYYDGNLGYWLSNSTKSLVFREAGTFNDNRYYRFDNVEINAGRGVNFSFPVRVTAIYFHAVGNTFVTSDSQRLRSNGIDRAIINLPNGQTNFQYNPPTPILIPTGQRVQLFSVTGGNAVNVTAVVDYKRTSA